LKGIYYATAREIEVKNDLPKPIIEPDEVLIKVKYCGICGSDVGSFSALGMCLPQIILGHEFSGEIAEIGENVKKLKVGNRVTANPNIPCLDCEFCAKGLEVMCILSSVGVSRDGALAEYINVRADRVHVLPESITYEEGTMIEPLSIAVQAVKLSDFVVGKCVAVFGAGTIGLMTIQVLKAAGASAIYVIEPVESKQKLALELGADQVFEPKRWSKITKLTKKLGPDLIFDCVGLPETIMTSMKLVKRGGTIMIIGIHPQPFEMQGFLQLMAKNITMKGMFLADQDSFITSIDLIEKKSVNVKPMITKLIKIEDVPEMFEILVNPPHDEIKVIVEME
jgi:2-desacetyl-2-hydroxyethyl bacteriochlorophyllide A dehydrogenase